jgi:hypothetical protein
VASDQALSASVPEIWTAPKVIVSSPAPMPHELTPMHDVLSEVKCWKWTRSWNLRTRNTSRALQFTPGRSCGFAEGDHQCRERMRHFQVIKIDRRVGFAKPFLEFPKRAKAYAILAKTNRRLFNTFLTMPRTQL